MLQSPGALFRCYLHPAAGMLEGAEMHRHQNGVKSSEASCAGNTINHPLMKYVFVSGR